MNWKINTLYSLIVISLMSCYGIRFSSKSSSVPQGDIVIDNFLNESGGGPPDLSQRFTEEIKEYYQRNAKSLTIVNEYNESETYKLEGQIVQYDVKPEGFTNDGTNEGSANSRLTISIAVTYKDPNDENLPADSKSKNSFKEKRFSFYALYDATKSLSDVEEELIEEIFEQIIIDIFNASFDNWK